VTTGVGKPGKPGSIPDGSIKTACQQSCPTDAIVFGDLADPNSEVRKLFEAQRSYALLEDLNTRPRVRYLSRVRNAEPFEDIKNAPTSKNVMNEQQEFRLEELLKDDSGKPPADHVGAVMRGEQA
jgi:hypothetical protein